MQIFGIDDNLLESGDKFVQLVCSVWSAVSCEGMGTI